MSANNGDRVTRTPLSANGESDDSGSIASKVVFAAGTKSGSPRVALANELETSLLEAG